MPLECPYCEHECEPLENREPDTNHEKECRNCGRTFVYEIEYEPYFSSWKAPCLNGKAHNYKPIKGFPEEFFKNKKRCSFCGHEKVIE